MVLPQGRTPRKRTGTKENCARSRTSPKENRPKQNWYECELVQQRTTRSRTARVRTGERYYNDRPPVNDDNNGGDIVKEPVCEDGWKLFNRPSGGWCIKVFSDGLIGFGQSQAKCNVYGGTLSGIQNADEISYMNSEMSRLIPGARGSAWVGGARINSCIGKPMGGECGSNTAFHWTDKSATGIDGFLWNDRQPDNYKLLQDCMVLWNAEVPVVWSGGASWTTGRVDDFACDGIVISYICGKKPTLK
uniref:C-type lectin domain-containing protein n=1 Tax=Caenorhabditis japonica TaxID=281687 RepID=A0A8R1HZ53_CAEJA